MNTTVVQINWTTLVRDGVTPDVVGYYSFERIRTPTHDYEDLLMEVGNIERGVNHLDGDFTISTVTVRFADRSSAISTKITTYQGSPQGKLVTIKVGDPTYGESALATVFQGKIVKWNMIEGECSILIQSEVSDMFSAAFGSTLDKYGYGNTAGVTLSTIGAPAELDGSANKHTNDLVPIVVGDMSTGLTSGIIPAYFIGSLTGVDGVSTKYRYVVAQHICKSMGSVYRYGDLSTRYAYWTAYTPDTKVYNGKPTTIIDFDFDQRDPDRTSDLEIAVTAKGMTVENTSYHIQVDTDSPSAYWRFLEASGTSVYDYTYNGLTGTSHGSASPGVSFGGTALADVSYYCMTLAAGTGYVSVPDNALLDPGDVFTLEAWVKVTALAGNQIIFDKGANSYQLYIAITTGFITFTKSAVAVICTSTVAVTATTWAYIAVTKNGAAVHIYLNGVDVSGAVTNATIAANASDVGIGATSGGGSSFLTGNISDFAIYPTALSATRIAAHYAAGQAQTLITNPVTALQTLMTNYFGFSSSDLDLVRWDTEEDKADANTLLTASAPLAAAFVLTDAKMTQVDVIKAFQESFLLSIFRTRAGLYAPYLYMSSSPTATADFTVTDVFDIDRDSLNIDSNDYLVSTVQVNKLYDPIKDVYRSIAAEAAIVGWPITDYILLTLNQRLIGQDVAGSSVATLYRHEELRHPEVQFVTIKVPLDGVNRSNIYKTEVLRDAPVGYWRLGDAATGVALDLSGNSLSGAFINYSERVKQSLPSLYLQLGETVGVSAADSSGNGLTGTYNASPTLGVAGALHGEAGTAITLNGSTQYISIPDNSLLDPGDTFTWEFWINPTTASPALSMVLVSKGTNSYIIYVNTNGKVGIDKQDTGNITNSTIAVTAGTWTHVVITKATTTNKIYFNGVDVTDVVSNQTITANATAVNIGRNVNNGLNFFVGSLDDIAFYPTALSAADVLAHYNAGITNVAVTPGALMNDSDGASSFDGVSDYIAVADNNLLDPGDTFTLEVWVMPSTIGSTLEIFTKDINGYELQIYTDGTLRLIKYGVSVIVASTIALTAGVWAHVVATKNGATSKLYINGTNVTGVVIDATIAATASALNIGRDQVPGNYFAGFMDEAAIYATALSADRVFAHYSAGIAAYGALFYSLCELNTVVGVTHWKARRYLNAVPAQAYAGQTVRILRLGLSLTPNSQAITIYGITNMLSQGA